MENNDVVNAEREVSHDSEAVEVPAGGEAKSESGGGGGDVHEGTAVTVASGGGGGSEFRAKRKRGRPRKQLGDVREEFMAVAENSATAQKRGRGRPRGSGKWQTLAASFGMMGEDTGGSKLTPHVLTIQEGENIVQRIWSFSEMTTESICILSAHGTISSAEIFVPATRGGALRYEGEFTIVCLNGSHTYDEKRGGKVCLLSVVLANPYGSFCGGSLAGSLIAAGPTQIIIATFRQKLRRQASKRPRYLDSPMPGSAAVPLQGGNGKLSDSEEKVVTTDHEPVAANSPDDDVGGRSSSVEPVDSKSSPSA